jgi:replicative DNA helicase
MTERIPPNDPALEMAVLGAMLQDDGAAATAAANLMPEDFYQDRHQLVFRAALRCLNRGVRPDVHVVGEELNRQGKLFEVGSATLAQLVEAVPTVANVAGHIRLVREKAERRRIIGAATEIVEAGYQDQEPLDEYRVRAEAVLFQAMQAGQGGDILTPAQLAATLDQEDPPLCLQAGLDILDTPRPIIAEGRLIVIAGRPGMGKTALACGILARLALASPPLPCFFLSLEQTAREIAERILSIQTGRSLYAVQTETLPVSAVERLATSGLYLSDAGAPSLGTVLGQIRAARASHGIRLVVLDHIGKVSGGRKESRTLEVGDVARGLKAIAKDLRIPVVVLCQLNRQVENRSVPRPQLSDLRESGEIEQEADAVVFLWTAEEGRRRAVLPVTFTLAKNRHGPEGEVTLTFDRPHLTFHADGTPR